MKLQKKGNMMVAIIDTGTTNTKFYIVDQEKLIAEQYVNIGCRDNIGEKAKQDYLKMLKDQITEMMKAKGYLFNSLSSIIAFGMISSDLGVVVVPHLIVPAGINELQEGVYEYSSSILEGVPFFIIRGIKNKLPNNTSIDNVFHCDFMRGEETQCMGVISSNCVSLPVNIITLGTHFKAVHINEEGKITKSMTTMSGQLFESIAYGTIVKKSVDVSKDASMSLTREEIMELAWATYEKYGFNRSILLPRFMNSFTSMTAMDRRLFLDSILAIDDLKSIREWFIEKELMSKNYVLIGQRSRNISYLLALRQIDPEIKVQTINDYEENRDISIKGALKICKKKIGGEK